MCRGTLHRFCPVDECPAGRVPDGWLEGAGAGLRSCGFSVAALPSHECWLTLGPGHRGRDGRGLGAASGVVRHGSSRVLDRAHHEWIGVALAGEGRILQRGRGRHDGRGHWLRAAWAISRRRPKTNGSGTEMRVARKTGGSGTRPVRETGAAVDGLGVADGGCAEDWIPAEDAGITGREFVGGWEVRRAVDLRGVVDWGRRTMPRVLVAAGSRPRTPGWRRVGCSVRGRFRVGGTGWGVVWDGRERG